KKNVLQQKNPQEDLRVCCLRSESSGVTGITANGDSTVGDDNGDVKGWHRADFLSGPVCSNCGKE
ncbi:MAG: hypothetical protein ABGZ35_08275, partial [Planctomycetaceae bacterium]